LRKSAQNGKSRRSYRRNGGRKKRESRVLILTLALFAVLVLGFYGLYHLKKRVSPDERSPVVSTAKMSGLVKDADRILTGVFFDLGISSKNKNIESEKVYKKNEGGVEWDYKEIVVRAPGGISGKDIKSAFKKSYSSKPSFRQKFVSSGNSLTVELRISGFKTHRVVFQLGGRKPSPANIAKEKGGRAEKETLAKKEPARTQESAKTLKPEVPSGEPFGREYKPRVAIIVDDIGMNKSAVDNLLELPQPVTLSILPNLPYSKYAAQKATEKGWEVMLHLPMEPIESSGYTAADAGVDALLVGMSKDAIMAKLRKNLSSVPYIRGVNNHMGSKFMQNQELTEMVLEEIKRRGLFFIDSLTTSRSVGYKTALNLGMKTGKRDVFLDNSSKDGLYVKSQIDELIRLSEKNGYAIGICHPYPSTIESLAEVIPVISSRVDLVPVSNVLTQGKELSQR
jgi:polysaccharide deacetylase 2 family uncharacterized protein YibQ